ncbi:hypothetical protein ACJQWK_10941 [Exserohilum turcicum]|uniref:Uncharacterized protein n=1 Tax=Exserohilum turcicum (strain 28A) TaxID=671987 RepID=R0I6W5_EXST2|nr:uncharacterized protein SETTUDRAFT_23713 [Exserohilum turcica Et28A]EOA81325.1 hypothetical protein SETTUDRAFT_23713 [Exserohilum turcica Et28A]
MTSDPYMDKIFVLDALTHSLNISMFELMSILTRQAPLSNLLLVPALKLQDMPMSTLLPMPGIHLHTKIPAPPTAHVPPPAGPPDEPDDLYIEFLVLYWASLVFVVVIAISAMLTKLKMSVHKSLEDRKPDLATKPLTDVERWCMRRQRMRELEAERQDEMKRAKMEAE